MSAPMVRILECLAEEPMRLPQLETRTEAHRSWLEDTLAMLIRRNNVWRDEEAFYHLNRPAVH